MAGVSTPRVGSGSVGGRLVAAGLALALGAGAAAFAREFHVDAIRGFRFEWGTWGAALVLAFGAGMLVTSAASLRLPAAVVVVTTLAAAAVMLHLPVVLLGAAGWQRWSVLATTSFVDRTGPQLLAAAIAGAAVASTLVGRPRSAGGRGLEPVQ